MFITISISAILTIISLLIVRYFFPKIGLLDNPKKYGHKRSPVPYPAGIVIPIVFFIVTFTITPLSSGLIKPLIGFLIASIVLLIISFIDDLKGVSPFIRLGVQIFAALIIIAFGIGIAEIRSPIGDLIPLDIWKIEVFGKHFIVIADTFAILWIVGMINAMNWLDGISGLTSSVSAIASFLLAISAYVFGQSDVSILFLTLSIICFVFFFFDLDSPKVLMGDSGSMFLGMALSVFTIIAGGKVAITMIILFPLIFDATWTIFRRLLKGSSPFKGDYEHLHHKLLEKIKSRRKVVLLYAFMVLLFGLIALLFKTAGKAVIIGILIIFLTWVEWFLHLKNNKHN